MAEGLVENLGGDFSENEGVLRGNPNIVKVGLKMNLMFLFGMIY